MQRKILLNPGPATTSDSVKYAQVVPDICPREEDFGRVMREVKSGLLRIAGAGSDYSCVLFGGSGTAVMDSVLSSAVHGKLLVINNGNYGERFAQIARAYNLDFEELKFDISGEIDLARVEERLKKRDIGYVASVHHETTSGILNPVKEIGNLCQKHGCVNIVDTISSFAGVPFSVQDCNMDFMMSTSNKCIQALPGVAFVIARIAELNKLKDKPKRNYYLDLYAQHEFAERKETGQSLGTGQTRFTPPVQTIYALRQAILDLEQEGGVEARHERYTDNYYLLTAGLKRLGFKPTHPERMHSKISTTFFEPDNMKLDFQQLHDALYKKGFTIYPNRLGDKKVIRFANMGDLHPNDIRLFLANLEEVLQ